MASLPTEAREGARIEKVTEVDLMNTIMATIGNLAQEIEILKQRLAQAQPDLNNKE